MDREALGRLTYTQWEAWLAIGFNKDGAERNLVIVAPAFGVKRGAKFALDDASRASQADHLARLKAIDFYPAKPFASADNLVARVFGSVVLDTLKKAGSVTKPRNLPFASLGGLFAGRDEDLADLHTALLGAKGAPVASRSSRRRDCLTSLEFYSTSRRTTPRPKRSSAARSRSTRRPTALIIQR
jgi:hypothetical protein